LDPQKIYLLSNVLPGSDKLDIYGCIRNSETLALSTEIENRFYHFIIRGIANLGIGQIYGTDITEQKRAEAETIKTSQLVLLGELAAGVAHEVNNPINGIINYSQILANKSSSGSEEHKIARRIIKESNRVAGIVRGLLSFAHSNKEEKHPVQLHEIMADSLSLVKTQLENNGITLMIDIPFGLPKIIANPHHIEQVFLNIINNARYALNQKYSFSDKNKVLEIYSKETTIIKQPFIRTVFHDKGTGISKEIIDNITDHFFSTKPTGKGTGLGLSISKNIISDHGGNLSIESTEGKFTKVIVDLPAEIKKPDNNTGSLKNKQTSHIKGEM
jgi:signal transduction histidine kinase